MNPPTTPVVSIDDERACPRCGKPFAFTASEKSWRGKFSPIGLDLHTSSMLCPRCQSERSTDRRAARERNEQLSNAVQLVARQPDDAAALLTLARATAEFAQAEQTGDFDRGIAAARRARRIEPNLHEALYWEAVCQDLAGRTQKALTLYEEFVESPHAGRHHPLVKSAVQRIAQATVAEGDSS